MSLERRVPASRLGRLGQLGRLAGGVAGGMLKEGARRLRNGERPSLPDLLLTPANVRRVASRLSEMRGAAMKVGQLLSMDNGNLLPPQLAELLSHLREDAHRMPRNQLERVLADGWGRNWSARFRRFDDQPIASASIGQVHRAVLEDGRALAIKVQYPGVRQSIDSDVDNVATLLRLVNLLPDHLDMDPVLDEAKRQLHAEADYRQEAQSLQRFAALLADDARFMVPGLVDELTRDSIIAMDLLGGAPIESLATASRRDRDRAGTALLDLAVCEVFEWGLVQTDPNFANFLYDADEGQVQLLDFGATRGYPDTLRRPLRALLAACLDGDETAIASAAVDVGYLADDDPADYTANIVRLLRIATEPARSTRPFAFRSAGLARRMTGSVIDMRLHERVERMPPTELLFVNRKLAGLYLLLERIDATVDVRALLQERLAGPVARSA